MQNLSIEGVEVLGASVRALVDGFQSAGTLATRILLAEGIGQAGTDGKIEIDPTQWYPVKAFLKAFKEISENMGESVHYQIGLKVPENAVFPPTVRDIDSALVAIDVAYYMNHRKDGKTLFDAATGKKGDGIGHYNVERVTGKNEIVMLCNNPYPCAFDRGLITAMAKRFQPSAWIFHDNTQPCRKKGGPSCTYQVKWT